MSWRKNICPSGNFDVPEPLWVDNKLGRIRVTHRSDHGSERISSILRSLEETVPLHPLPWYAELSGLVDNVPRKDSITVRFHYALRIDIRTLAPPCRFGCCRRRSYKQSFSRLYRYRIFSHCDHITYSEARQHRCSATSKPSKGARVYQMG